MEHQHYQKPHGVQMFDGVERETSGALCRVVAKLVGDEPVTELMERDAHQRRDKPEQDAQHVCEIQPVPY